MSVGDDKRVWLKERADAARVRMDEGVKALEEENKAWVSRVDDIEVLCLSGEIKSPAKILWVKRCPYCGGGLRKVTRSDRIVNPYEAHDDVTMHALFSCAKCDYEWAKSRVFTAPKLSSS